MPYRGKPSRGCQACRTRKIRCDQRKDGCRNCEKGNRVCPGYRDQLDLMFLDQTKQVTDKARRSGRTLSRTRCDTSPEREPPAGAQPLSNIPSMAANRSQELSADLEQRATRYFLEAFTLDRNVDEMYSIYTTTRLFSTPGRRALRHAVQALGLAGMSRASPDAHLMRLAESAYISSIRSMNAALSDPVEAKMDATLLGVLILTLFETFTNGENRDLVAWGSHIKGMAALLETRGKEQLHTQQGMNLFIQASIPICTNCTQLGIPLPPIMATLMEEALRIAGPNDSRLATVEHKLRFIDFYTAVRRKEITDLVSIVRQAKALDDEIATLLATLKHPWTYTTVSTATTSNANKDDEVIFLDHCHIFEHFLVAERHNGAWASRLLLNQMIRSIYLIGFNHRPPVFSSQADTDLFQEATANLIKVQDDIIATIPQYLGRLPNSGGTAARKHQGDTLPHPPPASLLTSSPSPPALSSSSSSASYSYSSASISPSPPAATSTSSSSSPPPPQPPKTAPTPKFLWTHFTPLDPEAITSRPYPHTSSSSTSSHLPLPTIRSTGGALLPWMLFLVAATDVATPQVKSWALRRLDEIGHVFGIHQSFVLRDRLMPQQQQQREGGGGGGSAMNYAWYRDINAQWEEEEEKEEEEEEEKEEEEEGHAGSLCFNRDMGIAIGMDLDMSGMRLSSRP